jgi:hypothetical protein
MLYPVHSFSRVRGRVHDHSGNSKSTDTREASPQQQQKSSFPEVLSQKTLRAGGDAPKE